MGDPRQIHLAEIQILPLSIRYFVPPRPRALHKRAPGIKHVAVKSTIVIVPAEVNGIDSFLGFNLSPRMFIVLLQVIPEPRL